MQEARLIPAAALSNIRAIALSCQLWHRAERQVSGDCPSAGFQVSLVATGYLPKSQSTCSSDKPL